MFIMTAKLTRKKIAGAVIAGGLLLCAFILLLSNRETPALNASNVQKQALAGTNEERIQLLQSYGWEIDPLFVETEEVRIPEAFDEMYTGYNEIQKAQGFNLEKYKNKRVKRISYIITNYPTGEKEVRVNLLVYKNKVIAGEVASTAPDGFMHGLAMPNT